MTLGYWVVVNLYVQYTPLKKRITTAKVDTDALSQDTVYFWKHLS